MYLTEGPSVFGNTPSYLGCPGCTVYVPRSFVMLEGSLAISLSTWKVKWSHYRPGLTQRVGRGIALLFHDRGTGWGWVVSSTPRPHLTPRRKEPVPILQEAGWAPGPFWTGGKSRLHRDSIPDLAVRSSVAMPTELPGPQSLHINTRNLLCVR